MRLAFISEATNNAYYRVVFPMQTLERRGHTVIWPSSLSEDLPMKELLRCDLVHCYRRAERIADLQVLADRGVAISFDNDDNYAAADMGVTGEGITRHRFNKQQAKAIRRILKLADVTTTPSAALAEVYRKAGAVKVEVMENRLSQALSGFGSGARHDGVVLGWVAGSEHRVDHERLKISKVLKDAIETHPELRVLTVGLRLNLDSDRYEHIPGIAFLDLLKSTSHMDIGIAPLADIPFNQYRSDVKLREYGSSGAAWLASNVGPYVGLGQKQGGIVLDDSEWHSAIDELISRPRKRRALARRAHKWAKSEAIEQHTQQWERTFLDTIERARWRPA